MYSLEHDILNSRNPVTGEAVWTGKVADPRRVDEAVTIAGSAQRDWERRPLEEREAILGRVAEIVTERGDELSLLISSEVGKPRWESATEVKSVAGKIALSIEAHRQRCESFSRGNATTRFRAHGCCAVFGPFNFPVHLPNGHLAPALLAGNTVVFKPSEHAPACGEWLVNAYLEAGVPMDALHLLPGGRATGQALAEHPGLRGLFFTGSHRTGQALARLSLERWNRIVALEMGGNNPLIAWDPESVQEAGRMIAYSAFVSAGQRCTCARRLIVPASETGDAILESVVSCAGAMQAGHHSDRPEPFMGPVIGPEQARSVLQEQARLEAQGAQVLLRGQVLERAPTLVSPVVVDCTRATGVGDEEQFGPMLRVWRVEETNFAEAIRLANETRYGLAAGLLSRSRERYEEFRREVRAGIVNWNTPLVGASSAMPFGGVGDSGNHRPSAYFAADYCSYPVASMEADELGTLPEQAP